MSPEKPAPWYQKAVVYQIWSDERPNAGFSDADPLQTFRRLFDVRREPGPQLTTWEETLADHPYDDDPKSEILHLHGFGYRWLRAATRRGDR